MRITIVPNSFTNNYNQNVQKIKTSNSFASALQKQFTTAEGQKAEDMVKAIEYLDKAWGKTEKDKSSELSKAQLDWLKGRYDINSLEIQRNNLTSEISPNGDLVETYSGYSMSEAHDNLIHDLYELGILTDRDMEILNANYLQPVPVPDHAETQILESGQSVTWWDGRLNSNSSFHEKFFNESLNPEWKKDISGYYRAVADNHLEILKWLESRESYNVDPVLTPHLPPNNWYGESAEVRNRIADIFDQIFK